MGLHFDSIRLMEPGEGTKRAKSGRKALPVEQKKTVRAILLRPEEWRWIERFGINPSQQLSTLIARVRKQETIVLSSANIEAFPIGN